MGFIDGSIMTEMTREPNDLLAYWQRYDWRESFFAPHVAILQALTRCGRTASGAGDTRAAAFQRCLGETAELHALAELARMGRDLDTKRCGLAAHVDSGQARRSALLEAFERFAAHGWWHGTRAARPLAEAWLDRAGLLALSQQSRLGSALKRRTDWWQIGTSPGQPCVSICRSTSPEGQDMLLGFGADPDPVAAARKALTELFLMEMNLMELLAARTVGQDDNLATLKQRISTYARRCPALLPGDGTISPAGPEVPPPLDRAAEWFEAEIAFEEITPPDGPIHVWTCSPAVPQSEIGGDIDSPFA